MSDTISGQTRADLERELFTEPPPPAKSDEHQALEQELFGGADSGGGLSAAQVASGKDPYGHPLQSIGAVPANDPVGQATGRPIAGDNLPGPTTQAIASLPTDPEQRRRVVAAQLFPGMPPLAAQSRVFQGDNGRLAAVGMDGKAFYVDPETPSVSRLSGFAPGNLLANAAAMAGPALPVAGGIAGGMIAAPTSLVAGPVAAGIGAAAGDVGRQSLANWYDPKPGFQYNPTQTASEAGGAAVGQLGGAAFVRSLAPNRLGVTNLDVNRLRGGAVLPEAERINALAQAQGVNLTPGQASGLPSLLGHEDAIASGSAGPGLSDIARTFYQGQGNQLAAAGQRMLDRVSSVADKTDAAMQFQQGAEDATRIVRQNANKLAASDYAEADATRMPGPSSGQTRAILGPTESDNPANYVPTKPQVLSGDRFKPYDLLGTPDGLSAYNAARVSAANDGIRLPSVQEVADGQAIPFQGWDHMKKVLQGQASEAARAGNNYRATQLTDIANGIKNEVISVNPAYGRALEKVAPGQRLASRLEDSVGSAAGGGNERARAIVAPVFEGNNPRAIAEARDAFAAAGRGDEWNAGVRSYVQDAFDKASQSQAGLNPAMLRRQVWGNVDNRASIQAAMDPAAYQGFDHFMQTVEATARTYPMNSLTAPRGEAKNALLGAAADTAGVHVAQAAGSALNPIKLVQIPGVMADKIASGLTGRNLRNISERLFSPEGMNYLRAMGGLSPGSQKAITATSEFLGQTAGRVGAANANAEPNRLAATPAR